MSSGYYNIDIMTRQVGIMTYNMSGGIMTCQLVTMICLVGNNVRWALLHVGWVLQHVSMMS